MSLDMEQLSSHQISLVSPLDPQITVWALAWTTQILATSVQLTQDIAMYRSATQTNLLKRVRYDMPFPLD